MKNDNHKWDDKLPTAQMLGRFKSMILKHNLQIEF